MGLANFAQQMFHCSFSLPARRIILSACFTSERKTRPCLYSGWGLRPEIPERLKNPGSAATHRVPLGGSLCPLILGSLCTNHHQSTQPLRISPTARTWWEWLHIYPLPPFKLLLVFPNLTPGKALPLALANSTTANVTHTEACKALAALQNHGTEPESGCWRVGGQPR